MTVEKLKDLLEIINEDQSLLDGDEDSWNIIRELINDRMEKMKQENT